MNFGLPFLSQMQGAQNDSQLGGWVSETFKQLVAAISGGYHQQHNADDTHGTVTATGSITTADRFYEGTRKVGQGYWTNVQTGFLASGYTGSAAMTWTVASTDVIEYRYTVIGKTMILRFHIGTGSTVGGVLSNGLNLPFPAGYAPLDPGNANDYVQEGWCRVIDGANSVQGRCVVENAVSPMVLSVSRFDAANFTGPGVGMRGSLVIEVQ